MSFLDHQNRMRKSSIGKLEYYALENGDYYKGSYNGRGLRHGSGHYLFKNGAQYTGAYRRGLKHGFGKFIYPDRSYYEGDWFSDVRHGRGKYTYRNGDHYDGEWSMGERHGLGSYYNAATQCTLLAVWQNGCRTGPGELKAGDYWFYGKWLGDHIVGGGMFTVRTEIMCSGYFDDHDNSSRWITNCLTPYDATQLPPQPGDFFKQASVSDPENDSAVSEVDLDHATDFVKEDVLNVTNALVEHVFTTKEIREITDSIFDRAVPQ